MTVQAVRDRPALHRRRMAAAVAAAAALWLGQVACTGADSGDEPDAAAPDHAETPESPAPAPLPIDSSLAPGVAGEDGWMYSRTGEADLDGDGEAERVVVMARAEVDSRGRPMWDDGQPWQVYVEEPDGERTYLYGRYVQLGAVTMRIGLAEGERPATVVLIEHIPDRLALYELGYGGPSEIHLITGYERRLDPYGDLASPQLP